jgi:hypothetical protein
MAARQPDLPRPTRVLIIERTVTVGGHPSDAPFGQIGVVTQDEHSSNDCETLTSKESMYLRLDNVRGAR